MHLTEDQLNEYLDKATNERTQIDLHLSSCDECAARLSTLQHLFAEIESLPALALTRDLAAPFTLPASLPAQLPRFLTLTVILQAAIALVVLFVAAPLVTQFVPAIEIPPLTDAFIQFQIQWTVWFDLLSHWQLPTLPAFPFEISSLYLTSVLAALSMLWLVGNRLLLRHTAK